jgi:hypothetical protein
MFCQSGFALDAPFYNAEIPLQVFLKRGLRDASSPDCPA